MTPYFTLTHVRIAYDIADEGDQTLVVIPGWLSHLGVDMTVPEIRSFYAGLGKGRRLIRYDKRGTGLSDRPMGVESYCLAAQVEDLKNVLDAAQIETTALFGWMDGGVIGLAFAAKYPERVSRLVLYASRARLEWSEDYSIGLDIQTGQILLTWIRANWRLGSRSIADFFIPENEPERHAWFSNYQRIATSPATICEILPAVFAYDVRESLPGITTPTLVLHRRSDPLVPLAHGSYLAEHLPKSSLQILEGHHHLPYFGNASDVLSAVTSYLSSEKGPKMDPRQASLSPRELEVLRYIAEGYQNREIASTLALSTSTVNRHLVNIFSKLNVTTRSAAAAYAFRHGLV